MWRGRSSATACSNGSWPSRRQRRAGPTRRGGARQPAHARADRQCPRERGDAASDPSRHLEPRAEVAIARQTAGLAEEVVGGVRASSMRFDLRAEELARRREPRLSPYAGIAMSARPRRGHGPRDRPLHGADGRPRTGGVARRRPRFRLDRGCVPRLRVALPVRRLLRPLLERRGPDARDAPAAAAGHHPRRSSALRVALARALLRPAPLDRAALRRLRPGALLAAERGLADFLAGTVVVYDEPPAAGEA